MVLVALPGTCLVVWNNQEPGLKSEANGSEPISRPHSLFFWERETNIYRTGTPGSEYVQGCSQDRVRQIIIIIIILIVKHYKQNSARGSLLSALHGKASCLLLMGARGWTKELRGPRRHRKTESGFEPRHTGFSAHCPQDEVLYGVSGPLRGGVIFPTHGDRGAAFIGLL